MVLNYPSPLAVKVFYTSQNRPHVHTVYVRPTNTFSYTPGLDVEAYEFLGGNGLDVWTFESFVNIWVNSNGVAEGLPLSSRGGIRRLLKDTDTIERAELWYYPPQSTDGLFLSAIALDVVGNSTDLSTAVPANQLTITARTDEGGVARFQMMEIQSSNTTSRYTYASAPNRIQCIINTIIDPAFPIIGKDGGRPIAFLRASMTQNERLYRKIYRS